MNPPPPLKTAPRFCDLPPQMMTLNPLPHEYDNYYMAPYIFSFNPLFALLTFQVTY